MNALFYALHDLMQFLCRQLHNPCHLSAEAEDVKFGLAWVLKVGISTSTTSRVMDENVSLTSRPADSLNFDIELFRGDQCFL